MNDNQAKRDRDWSLLANQVVGGETIFPDVVEQHDLLKLKVSLRLLVEKWRNESYSEDISHPNPPMLNSITLKKCAKELEELLK